MEFSIPLNQSRHWCDLGQLLDLLLGVLLIFGPGVSKGQVGERRLGLARPVSTLNFLSYGEDLSKIL